MNLRQLAEEFGVSIRTVSRAVNGNGYVRTQLRDQIRARADAAGYRPNPAARGLRTGRSQEVTVVVPGFSELHMEKIAGLDEALRPLGIAVAVRPADLHDPAVQIAIAHEVGRRRPIALVVIGSGGETGMAGLRQQIDDEDLRRRIVVIDGCNPPGCVVIDRAQGVYEATKYLVARGRRGIAYLGPPGSHSRTDGYHRAIAEAGAQPIVLAAPENESYRDAARGLLRHDPPIDAVQVYSDERAMELLAGLHDLGVRVPKEIAVVGFDNRHAAAYAWPPLTTVAQPNRESGRAAAQMVIQLAREPDVEPQSVTIPTRLVVRESA